MDKMRKAMDAVLHKGTEPEMEELGNIFVKMAKLLKDSQPEEYKVIKYEMHKLAYGEHLTEDQAKCWVEYMENKDGTKGEHWNYSQTEQVRKQYAPDADPCDWYAVLNMVYSDYYNPRFDTETYVGLAKDWIQDKDVPGGKTLKYYIFVVK